ncbi:MAG: hypothetical protein EOP04_10765 [Proteobacteria bacterium]|nr:MAG: hypothetical protein EOP04_10765 [Pseudomonadota bacterium]
MTSLILRESLSVSAGSVDKETPEWQAFWEAAFDTHSKAASLEGRSIGFLKAATLIKLIVFAHGCAAGIAHAFASGAIPRSLANRGRTEVGEIVVFDNEIQGEDNREALIEIWRSINSHQPKSNALGFYRTATELRLRSEQSEPLLLLADYVAGIVHAARSKVDVLCRSNVSREAAAAAFDRLQYSGKLLDISDTIRLKYFEIFPDFEKFSRHYVV